MAIAIPQGSAFALDFEYSGSTWSRDRADTEYYNIGSYFGRSNVLNLGILANTTIPNSGAFYQTEGYKAVTYAPIGATFVSGDLYIPSAWEAQAAAYASVGIWPTLGPSPAGPATFYGILNFYNGDDGGGKFRYWDGATYVDLATPVQYDAWNTLRLNYIPGATGPESRLEIVINGTVVGTITGIALQDSNPATDSQYEVILNSRTNGLSPYDVYWSNVTWSLNEQYYNAASLAATALVGGDVMLGTYVDRRGLDWDGGKAAWFRGTFGDLSFDGGNGAVASKLAGAQFGLDMVQFGGPETRAGLTVSVSAQGAAVAMPGGAFAGTTQIASTGVGAYLTHAEGAFYADLLGQYRFLDIDVTAPTSAGKVDGHAIDVAAEIGAHWDVSDNTRITPMGQLIYQHVALRDATLGGIDFAFGKSDALIGRARIMAETTVGDVTTFVSAGVSHDLFDGTETTASNSTWVTALGGTRAELAGGFEGKFGGGLSAFGAGEVTITVDGVSRSYVGRAGIRTEF